MLSRAVIPSEETWGLVGTPNMHTVSRFLLLTIYGSSVLFFYFVSQKIQNFGKVTASLILGTIVLGVPLFFAGLSTVWVRATNSGLAMQADLALAVAAALWFNIVLLLGCFDILLIPREHRQYLRPTPRSRNLVVQLINTALDVPLNLRYMKSGRFSVYFYVSRERNPLQLLSTFFLAGLRHLSTEIYNHL
jgi:hypothetical protein